MTRHDNWRSVQQAPAPAHVTLRTMSDDELLPFLQGGWLPEVPHTLGNTIMPVCQSDLVDLALWEKTGTPPHRTHES